MYCKDMLLQYTYYLFLYHGLIDGLTQSETCSQAFEREYKLCFNCKF